MKQGYGQYCPVARGAEVFAERWTPLVIRNIFLNCHTFSEILEGIPHISRNLLNQRLRSLERDGIVERRPNPAGRGSLYYLTPAGGELTRVNIELGNWAARWLALRRADMDPYAVLWAWSRLMNVERLPERRVVIRIDLTDRPKERFWLLVHKPDVEVCIKHPGFDEDLVLTTDCQTLTHVHMGRLSIGEAERSGCWTIDGVRSLARAVPTWGGTSLFAHVRPVPQPVQRL